MTFLMRFFAFVVNVMCLPLHVMHALGLYKLYKRVFPSYMYRITIEYNKVMREQKTDLFRLLPGFGRSGGRLTILEIGCGSGANFEFYPAGSKVTCTDPNPHFQTYLKKCMEQNEHLTYARFVVASGEDLASVEDESVDVVVCTLVLCSVSSIQQTLREAQRILRPGGAFFFLEHVSADPSTWTYFFQHVLQPVWYYFGDGCELTRETWKHVEAAGFSELKLRHIEGGAFFFLEHVSADPSTWTYFFQHVFQPVWYYFVDGCEATRETWKHVKAAGFSELKLRHIETPLTVMMKPHIIGYGVK